MAIKKAATREAQLQQWERITNNDSILEADKVLQLRGWFYQLTKRTGDARRALKIMRQHGIILPQAKMGAPSWLSINDNFTHKIELFVLGLHWSFSTGVCTLKNRWNEPSVGSIIFGRFKDDKIDDDRSHLNYPVRRSCDLKALRNSMRQGNAIRVFQCIHHTYTYIGLYVVEKVNAKVTNKVRIVRLKRCNRQ
eukprot:TRINITY_DN2147_c0_g1_i3.p1 TRINITY_DN2147_c0_g1~~TRINITY_DN2147_c0_g1_i3.p1  ORF type:complete len:194 (-),score=18.71 TRINITY_DN2147_c0_g1_i3:107-688(-)